MSLSFNLDILESSIVTIKTIHPVTQYPLVFQSRYPRILYCNCGQILVEKG